MACANWKNLAMLLAALLICQEAFADPPPGTDQYLTVNEGGQSLPCRIIMSWALPNGGVAYKVQNVGNGEYLTIVGDAPVGASGNRQPISMRAYHWGKSNTSPPSAPQPPARMVPQSTPAMIGVPSAAGPVKDDPPARMNVPMRADNEQLLIWDESSGKRYVANDKGGVTMPPAANVPMTGPAANDDLPLPGLPAPASSASDLPLPGPKPPENAMPPVVSENALPPAANQTEPSPVQAGVPPSAPPAPLQPAPRPRFFQRLWQNITGSPPPVPLVPPAEQPLPPFPVAPAGAMESSQLTPGLTPRPIYSGPTDASLPPSAPVPRDRMLATGPAGEPPMPPPMPAPDLRSAPLLPPAPGPLVAPPPSSFPTAANTAQQPGNGPDFSAPPQSPFGNPSSSPAANDPPERWRPFSRILRRLDLSQSKNDDRNSSNYDAYGAYKDTVLKPFPQAPRESNGPPPDERTPPPQLASNMQVPAYNPPGSASPPWAAPPQTVPSAEAPYVPPPQLPLEKEPRAYQTPSVAPSSDRSLGQYQAIAQAPLSSPPAAFANNAPQNASSTPAGPGSQAPSYSPPPPSSIPASGNTGSAGLPPPFAPTSRPLTSQPASAPSPPPQGNPSQAMNGYYQQPPGSPQTPASQGPLPQTPAPSSGPQGIGRPAWNPLQGEPSTAGMLGPQAGRPQNQPLLPTQPPTPVNGNPPLVSGANPFATQYEQAPQSPPSPPSQSQPSQAPSSSNTPRTRDNLFDAFGRTVSKWFHKDPPAESGSQSDDARSAQFPTASNQPPLTPGQFPMAQQFPSALAPGQFPTAQGQPPPGSGQFPMAANPFPVTPAAGAGWTGQNSTAAATASNGPPARTPYSTALPTNPIDPAATLPATAQSTVVKPNTPGYVTPASSGQSFGSLAQAAPPPNGYQGEWGGSQPPSALPPSSIPPTTIVPPASVLLGAGTATADSDRPLPFVKQGDRPNDPLLNPTPWDPAQRALAKPPTLPVSKNDARQTQAATEAASKNSTPPASYDPWRDAAPPASVVAASNGLPNRFTSPPPQMTIPPVTKPHFPPPPFIPEPMEESTFTNAFSPSPVPRSAAADGAIFTREQLMNPMVLGQLYATNPYLSNPAMLRRDYQYFNQLQPGQQMLVKQAVYIQQQQMQMQAEQQQQRPFLQLNYPTSYRGPLPPDPFGTSQVAQAQYQQTMYPRYPAYQPCAAPQYSPYAAWQYQQTQNAQTTLRRLAEAPNPDERVWAAAALIQYDCRWNPQIAGALIRSAESDPDAVVRASCVNTLSRARMAPAALLQKLRSDRDVRVRQEAEDALYRMGAGS